jgi:hypothetical protein
MTIEEKNFAGHTPVMQQYLRGVLDQVVAGVFLFFLTLVSSEYLLESSDRYAPVCGGMIHGKQLQYPLT